ncbi:MAG: hypothetical protein WCI71_04345 [Bacteroidota bacterium]
MKRNLIFDATVMRASQIIFFKEFYVLDTIAAMNQCDVPDSEEREDFFSDKNNDKQHYKKG